MGRLQCVDAGWLTWREAMQQALYGPDGFFRRESPADHFRTSVHASDLFAEAIANLAEVIGARTIVDVGAGRGELLATLAGRLEGVELTGVELVTRPADLPGRVSWTVEMPEGLSDVLVVANEWLDNIPLDVVEIDGFDLDAAQAEFERRYRAGDIPDRAEPLPEHVPGKLATEEACQALREAVEAARAGRLHMVPDL